jgi:hypothetical protein
MFLILQISGYEKMHSQLLKVLTRVASTATNALRVGEYPKLRCGALVAVMRLMVCV